MYFVIKTDNTFIILTFFENYLKFINYFFNIIESVKMKTISKS